LREGRAHGQGRCQHHAQCANLKLHCVSPQRQ